MSNTIKDIIHLYNEILNSKKSINEAMVKLNSTSYPNVKFDYDGTQNDSVNQGLLDDIQKAASAAGIVATITTAKTGHPVETTSGHISRHMNGTGVDIAILDGMGSNGASNSTNGNENFRKLGFKLKDALVSLGYTWNTESGNDKAVLWQTNTGGNHYNHLHISNKVGASSGSASSSTDLSGSSSSNLSLDTSKLKDIFKSTDTSDNKISSNDDLLMSFTNKLGKSFGLKEEKIYSDFGNNISYSSGKVLIPKDNNSRIKSPVNGKIIYGKFNSSCNNQITIEHDINGDTGYLQFCGISRPYLSDGQSVSIGKTIGETDSDVIVTQYDSSWNKLKISSHSNTYTSNNDNTKKSITKTPEIKKSEDKKPEDVKSKDPLLMALLGAPFKPFQDKYDKSGKMIEKRWGSPTEKEQPDNWISNLSPTHKKKVQENINRIKGLL
jgi:hypothetical protein